MNRGLTEYSQVDEGALAERGGRWPVGEQYAAPVPPGVVRGQLADRNRRLPDTLVLERPFSPFSIGHQTNPVFVPRAVVRHVSFVGYENRHFVALSGKKKN